MKFCEGSNDQHSVYKILRNYELDTDKSQGEASKKGFLKEERLMDTMLMLFGGFDNTSRLLTSLICMLKRNQRVYEKLTEALKECKITQIDHLDQDELASTYQAQIIFITVSKSV